MNKQTAGFKFGKNSTKLVQTLGQVSHNGRTYRLCLVEADGKLYHSLRLYNARGKFIKQFMTEPEIVDGIYQLYERAAGGTGRVNI